MANEIMKALFKKKLIFLLSAIVNQKRRKKMLPQSYAKLCFTKDYIETLEQM